MIAARESILGAGHFLPLAKAIAELAGTHASWARLVMEAGAGTGYYVAHVLDSLPRSLGLAIDLSKYAARRAARAHLRLDAVIADVFEPLPVQSGAVDLAVNVFAPRPAAELHRVLSSDGRLIVAVPTTRHLEELRAPLALLDVDRKKEWRLERALDPFFRQLERRSCRWTMELNHEQIASLAGMGPSARHIGPDTLAESIAGLAPVVTVTGEVDLHVYAQAQAG